MQHFFKSWKILSYLGKIIPPPDGKRLIFTPGSTEKIQWSFDGVTNKVKLRQWIFTSNGSEKEIIGSISEDGTIGMEKNWESRARIAKPATLVLINVDHRFNGTYTFTLVAVGGFTSEVTVFIAGTFCSNKTNLVFSQFWYNILVRFI
jgi:hypothetical protein